MNKRLSIKLAAVAAVTAGIPLLFPGVAYANAGNPINPIADTYVASAHANTNYGTASRLWAANDATNGYLRTYLKYDVTQSTVDGHNACEGGVFSASSAYLQMDVDDVGTGNHNVFRTATTDWTETGLTWNNKPAATGSAIGFTVYADEDSLSDVSAITLDGSAIDDACNNHAGILSLVIRDGSSAAVAWKSRESGTPPTLTVVVGD